MLIRVTDEFGSGFTIYAKRDVAQQVMEDYRFMGYSIRRLDA